MADVVLKLVKPELPVKTANAVYNCSLFRIYSPNISVITIRNSAGVIVGSMTMPDGFVETMYKTSTDTIEATETVFCTPIAYK